MWRNPTQKELWNEEDVEPREKLKPTTTTTTKNRSQKTNPISSRFRLNLCQISLEKKKRKKNKTEKKICLKSIHTDREPRNRYCP